MAEQEHETIDIEKSLARVKKAGRIIEVVCNALFVLAAIGLISMIGLFLFQALGIDLPLPIEVSVKALLYGLPTGILTMAFLKVVSRIFSEVAQGESPFCRKQVNRIRWIAYLLFAKAILEAALSVGTSMIAQVGPYNITYIETGGPSGLSLNIDAGAIFMGVLILCLSIIFEYGSLLQRFTDETA